MWGHTAAASPRRERHVLRRPRNRFRTAARSASARSSSAAFRRTSVRTWAHGGWPDRLKATISLISARLSPGGLVEAKRFAAHAAPRGDLADQEPLALHDFMLNPAPWGKVKWVAPAPGPR